MDPSSEESSPQRSENSGQSIRCGRGAGRKISEAYRAGDKQDNQEEDVGGTEVNILGMQELAHYCKDLALNPTYVFLTLFVACDALIMGGFTAFGPKYVQEQFNVSAAVSGMMFGIIVIPGGAGGTIAGGIIIKKMALKCAGIMKAEIIISITIMVTGFMFLIICTPLSFAGVTVGHNNAAEPDTPNFTAACNSDCSYTSISFTPICSTTNIQYYSPCHAGCSDSPDKKNFYNCTCIEKRIQNFTRWTEPMATTDQCTVEDCNLAPLFMVIFFCSMFCLFSCNGMNISATIRCLSGTHRSLGIGMQWIFLRLLGTVPGPIVFGAAFDQACVVFDKQADGSNGQCLFYDKRTLALLLFAICVGVKLISLVCITLAWKLYRPPTTAKKIMDTDCKPAITVQGNGVMNSGYEEEGPAQPISNKHVHVPSNLITTKL